MYESEGSPDVEWVDLYPEHAQVLVCIPAFMGGGTTTVDVELELLLAEVWGRGWPTWSSCQDWGDGTAQVVFNRGADVVPFLTGAAISDGAVVKVLVPGLQWGPFDNPAAVHFDRRLIGLAAEQLHCGLESAHVQNHRQRAGHLEGGNRWN